MHVTAEDQLPLVTKLTREERIRLARLALQVASSERIVAAEACRRSPEQGHEVADNADPLGWDAEGWDDVECAFPPGVR